MFRVILCGCSPSKALIEERLSGLFLHSSKTYEILEFFSVDEVIKSHLDFDMLFIDEEMKVEISLLLEYMQTKRDKKNRAWAAIDNPISEETLKYINEFFSKYLGFSPMYLKLEFLTDKGIKNIPIKNIHYFEFMDRKVKIQSGDAIYFTNDSLKNVWELVQSHGFYQVHKSIIVNLDYVLSIKNYLITMTNGEQLPLAQKKSKDFRTAFSLFAKDKI